MKEKSILTLATLRFNYLHEAAWFYYRTLGNDEGLVSSLHRVNAADIGRQIRQLGHEPPSAEEIYAQAAAMFPASRLHDKP